MAHNFETRMCADIVASLKAGVLQKLTELKEPNLSNNKICRAIGRNVFKGLVKLQLLDLSNNSNAVLCETLFDPLVNLEVLQLSRTMSLPMIIPDWLYNIKQFRYFSYALNHLDRLPSFTR